uniref:hypothetical protein n=1 Tax=Thaumasiovibrio occultus TaxID=1891184 RepID=UPI00131C36E3|nr:hypothetical protein [Thaumasiovibrio occultus]
MSAICRYGLFPRCRGFFFALWHFSSRCRRIFFSLWALSPQLWAAFSPLQTYQCRKNPDKMACIRDPVNFFSPFLHFHPYLFPALADNLLERPMNPIGLFSLENIIRKKSEKRAKGFENLAVTKGEETRIQVLPAELVEAKEKL